MNLLEGLWTYLPPFLVVLTVLVFVHELGHYLVARWNGVRVEVFSIGFGTELFGFTDRAGTRWKFSLIPLGGYVKMYGDADPTSTMAASGASTMTPEQRAVSFHHKRVGQRAAVIFAGPAANFLFAFLLLAVLLVFERHPYPPAEIGAVPPGSAAAAAGLQPGDEVLSVNGQRIDRFADLARLVQASRGQPLTLEIERDAEVSVVEIVPQQLTPAVTQWRLGIAAASGPFGPLEAVRFAASETVELTVLTLRAIGEMVVGARDSSEIGGPLRIAQVSGSVAQAGVVPTLWLIAFLSINLGLINLFPIPLLDGGHLVFHAVEAVRGRPLGARAQEYGFRIGLALVLTLMVFATWNDLVELRVIAFLRGLIS